MPAIIKRMSDGRGDGQAKIFFSYGKMPMISPPTITGRSPFSAIYSFQERPWLSAIVSSPPLWKDSCGSAISSIAKSIRTTLWVKISRRRSGKRIDSLTGDMPCILSVAAGPRQVALFVHAIVRSYRYGPVCIFCSFSKSSNLFFGHALEIRFQVFDVCQLVSFDPAFYKKYPAEWRSADVRRTL